MRLVHTFMLSPLVVLTALGSGIASDPGEPLDCSDFVFTRPGFHCEEWIPFPCESQSREINNDGLACGLNGGRTFDNQGRELRVRHQDRVAGFCGSLELTRHSVLAFDGVSEELIAYIDDRCVYPAGPSADTIARTSIQPSFDAIRGRAFLTLPLDSYSHNEYPSGTRIVAISGFAPLFDIIQSFEPETGNIGFVVPVHPEGFDRADYFDTYWGPLERPLDLSRAQPMSCNYPAMPPLPGTSLSVPDSTLVPAPGGGVYFLTAATRLGEARGGRQARGGRLEARSASLLPECRNVE